MPPPHIAPRALFWAALCSALLLLLGYMLRHAPAEIVPPEPVEIMEAMP